MAITHSDVLRYADKFERRGPDECWPWTASPNRYGYGQFRWQNWKTGKSTVNTAHRFGAEMRYGPLPDGIEVDHAVCQNPLCQNPAHWELVPKSVNVARGNSNRRRKSSVKAAVAAARAAA